MTCGWKYIFIVHYHFLLSCFLCRQFELMIMLTPTHDGPGIDRNYRSAILVHKETSKQAYQPLVPLVCGDEGLPSTSDSLQWIMKISGGPSKAWVGMINCKSSLSGLRDVAATSLFGPVVILAPQSVVVALVLPMYVPTQACRHDTAAVSVLTLMYNVVNNLWYQNFISIYNWMSRWARCLQELPHHPYAVKIQYNIDQRWHTGGCNRG